MGSNKIKSMYVCSECGWESSKWVGKCQGCGSWNTMQEEIRNTAAKSTASSKTGIVSLQGVYAPPVAMRDIDTKNEERYKTNLKEFDRVLGGGIVKGSLVLLGGDPGIGKSTILLQVCNKLGNMLNAADMGSSCYLLQGH